MEKYFPAGEDPSAKRAVLCVDDDEGMREMYKRKGPKIVGQAPIGVQNCEVSLAEDGAKGLEVMRSEIGQRAFLLIVDGNMPEMNGLELITEIRQSGNNRIAIVLASGGFGDDHTAKAEMERLVESGEIDFVLNKPFSISSALPPAVIEALRHRMAVLEKAGTEQ